MLPSIRVKHDTKSQLLVLDASEVVSESDWNLLLAQWLDRDNQAPQSGREIYISPAKFADEFQWFRTNWNGIRGQLILSEDARALFRANAEKQQEFLRLLKRAPDSDASFRYEPLYEPPRRPLTEFQKKNVQRLLEMPNGANFSVPGAGKTAMTLATFTTLRLHDKLDRILVVCPKSAFESWQTESLVFGFSGPEVSTFSSNRPIQPSVRLLTVNYEQLQNDIGLSALKRWTRQAKTHLVFDEAHRVKGGPGKTRWNSAFELAPFAKRIDLLTGTPMPQGLDDLRNIFRLSWPQLKPSDLNDGILNKMTIGTTFVRTTKDELGLPPMKTHLITEEMSPIQSEIYKALRNQYSGLIRLKPRDARELARRGRAIMTLLATATNPGLLSSKLGLRSSLNFRWPLTGYEPNVELMALIDDYAEFEIPWKFVWLRSYAERIANSGKKAIIWTNFIGNIKAVETFLAPLNPVTVYGKHSPEERIENIKQFRTDSSCSILITNAQTLGEGVSLHHECHDAVYLDRSFNAGLYLQSLDRIHRLGLPKNQITNSTVLSSLGSIDTSVENRLSVKISRMALLLNDNSLLSSASTQLYDSVEDELDFNDLLALDDEDLRILLGHLG